MSTTVIQYLDPAAVAALQEQAALRAAEKAKQTSDADFSTALSEATKSLTTAEQLASAGSYSSDDLDAIFTEVNPIPVKEAMDILGLDSGRRRLPLVPMAPANRARLEKAMADMGVVKGSIVL